MLPLAQLVFKSSLSSMVMGSIRTTVKLAVKSEESHQLSVIPSKRKKEFKDVGTSNGRAGSHCLGPLC